LNPFLAETNERLARLSRYIHLILDLVQYFGYLRLKALVSSNPSLTPEKDITVISSTLGEEENYIETVRTWLRCDPKTINIITVERAVKRMKTLIETLNDNRIKLYIVEKPDIRRQLTLGIQNTATEVVVLVDDDSQWSPQTLRYLASAFSDPSVGGANTMQYVRPHLDCLSTWESFGALNLVRRNILHSAVAYFNHGQVLNLSGRTVAYRTSILNNDEFFYVLLNDYWRGRFRITTGDDSFITSWIVNRGWETVFLKQRDAVILTNVNDNWTYLRQVLRWSRDTARHYLRDLGSALKTGRRRLYIRSFLNWISNYTTDFLVLTELTFLFVLLILGFCGFHYGRFDLPRYDLTICSQI